MFLYLWHIIQILDAPSNLKNLSNCKEEVT